MESRACGSFRGGFSLLELAIVLAVIALLAGAILLGKELVRGAELRRQVSQIERFRTSVLVFRQKYGSMPGDLAASDAAAVGFRPRSGTRGHGDGNGAIESCDADCSLCGIIPLGCEVLLFWSDLDAAGFLESSVQGAQDDYMQAATFEDTLQYLPATTIGRATVVPTMCGSSGAWLVLVHITNVAYPGGIGLGRSMAPTDVYSVDAKCDDGSAARGQIVARSAGFAPLSDGFFCLPAGAGSCVGSDGEHRKAESGLVLCQINVRIAGGR